MKLIKQKIMFLILSIGLSVTGFADMEGSRDHPDFPRIKGSKILGYDYSVYGEGIFHSSTEGRRLNEKYAEGEHTRIIYLAPENSSPLGVLRNYQKIFSDLGQVNEIFFCKNHECFRNLGGSFIWHSNNRIPDDIRSSRFLYSREVYYRNQLYWYGTIQSDNALYTISLYTAVRTDQQHSALEPLKAGDLLIHLEIIKDNEFEPTLQTIKSEEISKTLSEQGHIAIYGIYFDTDSAELKSESTSALGEIAKALTAQPDLQVYVVGHTDNEGSMAHNERLSRQRAESVVDALDADHGIDADRLTPIGVGPVAPIASNTTDEGKALNRRVEIVAR